MEQHVVPSGDVRLAVREHPRPGAPTVVLVHGFPDTAAMWDPVVARLTDDHGLRVVTYDVRGAGLSTAPASVDGYRTDRLVGDLVAVLDQVAPAERVHLVGHDWGSTQLWDAVTSDNPDVTGRIASFTSISGPSLDHVAHFARRLRRDRDYRALLRQVTRSWYVYAFHLPVLPELAWRIAAPVVRRSPRAHFGPTLGRDAANGLNLYRANIRRRMRRPGAGRTAVPVQLVVPLRDAYITSALLESVPEYVTSFVRTEMDAGHWAPRQRPEQVAQLVADFVAAHDSR